MGHFGFHLSYLIVTGVSEWKNQVVLSCVTFFKRDFCFRQIEGPEAAYVQSDLYADVMQPPQEVDVKPPNPINQNTGQPV